MHVCQLCICPNIHKPISAEIWSLLCVHGCIAMCAQFPNIACTHACVPMVYKCDVTGENLCNSLRYMCSCTCGENSLHNRMHSYTTTRAIALLYAVAHTCILRQYCHCIATIYCMVVWFVAGWHMSWKNIFQHVWLSQYWNCMAGCNVELLWNMWYKTDQRISQFPACWFVFCIVTHVMKTHILTYMIITILSMYGVMSLSNLKNKTCIHVMTRALGSGRNIAFLCDTKNTIIALESGMNIAFLCDKKNMSIALGSGGTLHSWTIRKHEHCTRIWEEHWNQSTKNYDCTGFRGARRFPLSCISVCIYALHDVCLHIYIMQLQYGITLQTQAHVFTRDDLVIIMMCGHHLAIW